MASFAEWVAGARPRTLPAAVAPVLAGTGAAAHEDAAVWWKAALALVVALALQVGVNYANDYSDGVRGTDADRVGPMRLVGSGAARPVAVKRVAWACFAVGCVAGAVLAATSDWWLLAVGAVAVAAAWFYTGGTRPYGYQALGEVSVFVFFGLVAVLGTTYVQAGTITRWAVLAGAGVGALACAVLVANNLRDVPSDTVAGKRTLAVVLGDRRSRWLYLTLLLGALAALLVTSTAGRWVLLGLLAAVPGGRAYAAVARGAQGRDLIAVLRDTGLALLLYGAGIGLGLAL